MAIYTIGFRNGKTLSFNTTENSKDLIEDIAKQIKDTKSNFSFYWVNSLAINIIQVDYIILKEGIINE